MIYDLVKLAVSGVKTLVNWGKEKTVAKHKREMAQIELETRLLLSQTEANSKWEMAQLNDKDKILRWAAFILFASPLLAHFISPELGKRIQDAWHMLPDWQSNVLSGMCLAVFGMKKIPELLGSAVGAIRK